MNTTNQITENKFAGIVIKPSTLKQLAALYEIGVRTLYSWIEPFRMEIGKIRGRCLTIPQVKIIFEKLDLPPCYQLDDTKK